MYEHLSRRVNAVLKMANQIARDYDLEYVGTEHILLALAREGSGLGARILNDHGITEEKIEAEVRKLVKASLEDTWVFGRLPGTPHFRNVIAQAIEEARNLKSQAVCTEHLLLGLLAEKGSVAQITLKTLGLNSKMVREAVLRAGSDACGDAVGAG